MFIDLPEFHSSPFSIDSLSQWVFLIPFIQVQISTCKFSKSICQLEFSDDYVRIRGCWLCVWTDHQPLRQYLIADATLSKTPLKETDSKDWGILTMFGSIAKHVVVNTIGVLVLATACLTFAFSLDTVPIWAPSSDHASYVFLRPKAASSIVSKGIAGPIAEAVVRVSASQDWAQLRQIPLRVAQAFGNGMRWCR